MEDQWIISFLEGSTNNIKYYIDIRILVLLRKYLIILFYSLIINFRVKLNYLKFENFNLNQLIRMTEIFSSIKLIEIYSLIYLLVIMFKMLIGKSLVTKIYWSLYILEYTCL